MPAPHHSVFSQVGCRFCHPTNSIKALKATLQIIYSKKNCTEGSGHKVGEKIPGVFHSHKITFP